MTYSPEQLERMLWDAAVQARGPTQTAAIEEVFHHADAQELPELAFTARMMATDVFHHGGEHAKAFLTFSWCLAAFDQPRYRLPPDTEAKLRWHFKWMIWALPQFPDIPLARTYDVLDDMERRYLRANQSLHAVYQHRWLVAFHVGDEDAAGRWYELMTRTSRDANSDCVACVPASQVRHLTALGRFEEAVRIGEPAKAGRCSEQPQWINTELLVPYLHTGRYADAVASHRLAYQRMRSDPHHLDNIAQHVVFCGLTGNDAYGLELIERHVPWLNTPSTPFAAMEFAAAAAFVLGRLVSSGQGGLKLRRAPERTTVAALHAALASSARDLAARFDARNGTSHQTDRVETRMAADPLADRLPLKERFWWRRGS
jgi:hypothetical protein